MPDTIDQNQQTTPADTYRWPQKVKRYGLNTHPFLRLFVALFENTVPWNKHPKGWDANLLNEYIRETLLPALKPTDCVGESNVPFSDKYYLKNIALEAALQADEHAELVALRSDVSSDPDGVKSKVLHFFNKRKQGRFTKWWDFMNREYLDEPAWIYCVLKSVFDECGRGVRRPPDRVEPDALRKLAAAVQQGKFVPGVGIANRYVIERMSQLTGTDRYLHNGWTRIPGLSTQGPSDAGVRLLAFLGRKAGWCVASEGTGRHYLSDCDFFVMCDRDNPVVGARIGKDTIYEAAGYRNGAQPFTRDIELLRRVVFPHQTWNSSYRGGYNFFQEATRPWSDGEWREVLKRFPFGWGHAPEHIRSDIALKNEVFVALVRQSAMDPFWAFYIPAEFANRAEFSQLAKESWKEHLMNAPVQPSKIPHKFWSDPDIREAWQFGWEYHADSCALEAGQIPEQILRSETFKPYWAKGWERAFNGSCRGNITTWWQQVPHELRGLPNVRETWINGWVVQLRRFPRDWIDVPNELRELPRVREAWINGWEVVLQSSPKSYKDVPGELREQPTIREAWMNACEVELRRYPKSYGAVPNELKELPSIRQAWIDGWEVELRNAPERYKDVPDELREQPSLRDAWINACEITLRRSPERYKDVPDELKEQPTVREAWINACEVELRRYPKSYEDVPNELKKLPCVRQAWIDGWEAELRRSPESFKDVPDELRKLPGVRDAWFTGSETAIQVSPGRYMATLAELGKLPCARDAWIIGWELVLKIYPEHYYKDVPDELRGLPSVRKAEINGWEAGLRRYPDNWGRVPDALRKLPTIKEALINGLIQRMERLPKVRFAEREFNFAELEFLFREKEMFELWDSKMQQALAKGHPATRQILLDWWIRYISVNAISLEEVPETVLSDLRFLDAWRANWLSQLQDPWTNQFIRQMKGTDLLDKVLEGWAKLNSSGNPFLKSAIPDGIRHALALIALDKSCSQKFRMLNTQALNWLEKNPWQFKYLPQEQQHNQFIWHSCKIGWIYYLQQFPRFADVLPNAFSDEETVKAILTNNLAAQFAFEAEERANKFAEQVAKLKVFPGMSDEELPPAFAANAEIRKARERYWRGIMKENPRAFPRVPESLRSDAKLLANLRAALGSEIRSNPLIWETLHEVIRADECLQRVHRIATRSEDFVC